MGVKSGLLQYFFPSVQCKVCGGRSSREYPGLCPLCLEKLRAEREKFHFCSRCAMFYPSHFRHCPHCFGRGKRPYFHSAYAAFPFETEARHLVHALKYRNCRALGETMAKLMAEGFNDAGAYDCLVPVPLHPQREKARGYNQAAEIGAALSPLLGLPMEDKLLCRVKDTGSQTALKGRERKLNLLDAFGLTEEQDLAGRGIILLDDVITTGSTMTECAKTLRRAGAGKVLLFAFSASFF